MNNRVIAFYDVDETIWRDKSVQSFFPYYLECKHGTEADEYLGSFRAHLSKQLENKVSREELNRWFYNKYFENVSVNELREIGASWYENKNKSNRFWNESVLESIEVHKNKGNKVVLVSGSFRELLLPLLEKISVTEYLCTPLEQNNDRYSGKLTSNPMIGYGKANAIVNFMSRNKANPKACFAYGDDVSDVPFVGSVGNSYIVTNNGSSMSQLAIQMGFNRLLLDSVPVHAY